MTATGIISGLAIAGGLIALVAGLRKTPVDPARRPRAGLATRLQRRHLPRRQLAIGAAATAAGFLLASATGWWLAVIVLPAAALGLPPLIRRGGETDTITHLEALEEWTRALAGVLDVGQGLTDALTSTLRSAPAPIRPQVELLVARLQARQPAEPALRAFADDLDDPTADLIAASLILGARNSGAGLTRILTSLANTVADEVDMRRQVEQAREEPRSQARLITLISIAGLTAFIGFTHYGRAYHTPTGQIVLVVLLAGYAGCLYWMHAIGKAKPPARFLRSRKPTRQEATR